MFDEPTGYGKNSKDSRRFERSDAIEPRHLTARDVNNGYEAAFADRADGEPGEARRVFAEAGPALANGLRERSTQISGADVAAALQSEFDEGDSGLKENALFSADEDPFAGTVIDPQSVEARAFETMGDMQTELDATLNDVGVALAEGKIDSAITRVRSMVEHFEKARLKHLPTEIQTMYDGVKRNLDAALQANDPTAKSKLYRFACGAADFVPVLGPAKMLAEATRGTTFGGDELHGWQRFLHGTEGLVFLAVDLTGFGAVATKLAKAGKGGLMSAKLLTRTAALMRVLKVPRNVYKPIFRSGTFLLRHPRLAALATRGLQAGIKERQARLTQELPKILQNDLPVEPIANPNARDGMTLDTPPDYELVAAA